MELKKNLVTKRLLDLTPEKKDDSGDMDQAAIRPKTEANEGVCSHSGIAVSTSAMERALNLQNNLSLCFPSCLRQLHGSHVSGSFCLHFPRQFSCAHLPKHDEMFILVDEDGNDYDTKYLASKRALSAGWRGFSIAHKLLVGDVLIFQLIAPSKLKVYIMRRNSLTVDDQSIDFVDVNPDENTIKCSSENIAASHMISVKTGHRPGDTSLLNPHVECGHQEKDAATLMPTSESLSNECIRFSEPVVKFEDVKCLEDFNIQVDGLILDSKIPTHLRQKYYNLCCTQKKFLHENLIEGLNSTLSAGMISEVVNIAEEVKSISLSTSLHHLETWDKTLKALEDLGMAVGFLRARIHKLKIISRESQAAIEMKLKERDEAEQEMKGLNSKLLKVQALVKSLNAEIQEQKEHVASVFKEVTGAPW